MYKYNKKSSSVLFGVMLVLGIVLFTVFGGTFAYFQINNQIESQYELGKVDAYWYNGVEEIPYGTVNLATSGTQIVRGDNKGVNLSILATADSTTAGKTLFLTASSSSAAQYVRIKFDTYIVDSTTSQETEVDLSEHISFRTVDESGSVTSVFGVSDNWVYAEGDGWYYFRLIVQPGASLQVCNNIFLASSFPEIYLSQQLKIEFSFETIQVANNAINIWGESAKTALGLSEE